MSYYNNLTHKQREILKFLQHKVNQEGRPPTIREIGERFGFKSTGTPRGHLISLRNKGYIKLSPRQARSIELTQRPAFKIALLGHIKAGTPDLAFEENEKYLTLNDLIGFKQDQEIFALSVKGDSLIDKGIDDGDTAIVKRQRVANDKDIVAALIEGEATIKIFRKTQSRCFLTPANKAYQDIYKPFTIIGKVITVVKRFG